MTHTDTQVKHHANPQHQANYCYGIDFFFDTKKKRNINYCLQKN